MSRCLESRGAIGKGLSWWFASALLAVSTSGPECWTDGITPGQCCNFIFGEGGNGLCWDAGEFTFQHCCKDQLFHPKDCSAFITHFSFNVVGRTLDKDSMGSAWEKCAVAMEKHQRCYSSNITKTSCPECAALSEHLITYIGCVRQEQHRESPSGSCPACGGQPLSLDEGGGSATVVGGYHFPTLLRPRSQGRDFTLLASGFDMTVGTALLSEGSWMKTEVQLLQAFLPKGGIAVDAGANIGGFALPLSKHVGPDGQVHAFEPFRNIFQILTANCAVNGLLSCHTYHNGLGSRVERRSRPMPGLSAVGNPSKSHVVEHVASELLVHHDSKGRTETVEVVTLDEKLDLPRLDVIKIDVESSEYDMLLGAERTIQKHQPLIYVEDSEGESLTVSSPTRVVRLLSERHGYVCLNLADSGVQSLTSLLCAPQSRMSEVNKKLMQSVWPGGG